MRIEFYTPAEMSRETVRDMLGLVDVKVSAKETDRWTKHELILAYDWAAREHLRASDVLVRRRDKPSFLTTAGNASSSAPGQAEASWDDWMRELRGSQRHIDQDLSMTIGAAMRAIDELRQRAAAAEEPA